MSALCIRELTAREVKFTITIEPEHVNYVGNCMASGDDAIDKKAENWIRRQLRHGNEWAWCSVCVTAKWDRYEAHEYLGCCSYKNESDFKLGGYYDDMKAAALEQLNQEVSYVAHAVEDLRVWDDDENVDD